MNRRLVIGSFLILATAACGGSSQKATETKPDTKQTPASSPTGSQAAGNTAAGNAAPGAAGAAGAQQGAQQAAQGLQQMMQGLQQMSKNTAKPVDSDDLKTLIPDISGWTKGDVHGEMTSSAGFAQSNAKAKYTKGDSTLELEITDSTANQLLLSPLMMVMSSGYEEKSDDGYKKAVQISGFPGFEEWEKGAKHAEATAVVNNRFIVQANAHDVDSTDAARKAVEAVNLTKLASMK